MANTPGVADIFLPDQCLPVDVEHYSNKDVYVNCSIKRAWIGVYIGTVIVLIFIIILMVAYRDSTGGMVVVGLVGLTVLGLVWWSPYWRGLMAEKEYVRIEEEFAGEKTRDPQLTWSDFLKNRLLARQAAAQERSAAAQQQMASAQTAMAFSNFLPRHQK
jgi:hypothetical protein